MSFPHIMIPGETLNALARRYSLHSWQAIYFDAANDNLRQMRASPRWIRPGDVVMIPGCNLDLEVCVAALQRRDLRSTLDWCPDPGVRSGGRSIDWPSNRILPPTGAANLWAVDREESALEASWVSKVNRQRWLLIRLSP